ncbi:uracil-DNA glycosylase family protein [Geosporobacter ferrireducens]|uniref:Uracil-DNA glycosylase n=1 Tax=Geosporobacter ferrireducens TaxID=1424294 RepID=A0A1D8GNG4_9FIRM|nr:uracil-DNA glycosylase family protein [Geosporobacter ferrireducens]AOT72471.1 uracil-DNA glycosylase [Geosporobacter ferrireducens]MTI56265.1 uracil-DNA glycosylase [Geosporobacter ferrireducens]
MVCNNSSCSGIEKSGFLTPKWDIDCNKVKIIMISEAPPMESSAYFSEDKTDYMITTIQAFNDAGLNVKSLQDIISLGFQITTAIKCPKIDYSIPSSTIKICSELLESELKLYQNAKVYMLMGDVAISAINNIARRQIGKRVIPNNSTYKIRNEEFMFGDIRIFPSYLQTGKNYLIEKSKRSMIADDINRAFNYVSQKGK